MVLEYNKVTRLFEHLLNGECVGAANCKRSLSNDKVLGTREERYHCYNENRFSPLSYPSTVLMSHNEESLNSDAPSGGISNQGYNTKYLTKTYHLATPNIPLHLLHSAPS